MRATIFPGNKMGPPAPPAPTEEEALEIRRKTAEDLTGLVPDFILKTFFATNDKREILEEVEADILDCFSNENMNKHLIYGILELIIVRLIPEMAEKSPSALLAERGVVVDVDVAGEKEDSADSDGF